MGIGGNEAVIIWDNKIRDLDQYDQNPFYVNEGQWGLKIAAPLEINMSFLFRIPNVIKKKGGQSCLIS